MNPNDFFSMFDNLYYLDQLGSVDDQVKWLKSLDIVHVQYVSSRRDGHYVQMVVRSFYSRKFYLKLIKIYPGVTVQSFLNYRVVNLPRWFLNNGYCVSQNIVQFKSKKSCIEEEENTDVDITADAVDPFPLGD